jgi:two-component system sensor histidine kinase VicK
MDYLQRLIRQTQLRLALIILLCNGLLLGIWWLARIELKLPVAAIAATLGGSAVIIAIVAGWLFGNFVLQPLRQIWQTVLHLTPSVNGVAPPKPESLRFGRELVTQLSAHIYELATAVKIADTRPLTTDLQHSFLAMNLPLPLIVLDPAETIVFANQAAGDYIGIKPTELAGKNVYMVLDMSFASEDTFDTWLRSVKGGKATAVKSWERVRLNVRDSHPVRLFDMAAYYNRDNPEQMETMVVLFDHTKQYSQDDQAISFTALSVHELRTPLTLLRGYIEVLDEELQGKVGPELQDFILKMQAQAEQLTAFVNNILNVARVDDDQLELHLEQEDWSETLKSSVEMISLQARVRGITIKCSIDKNLPPVAIDKLSIREVVNNLIDNAIKYSGKSTVINVESHLDNAGLVETTVQDFGLGISPGILPNLFTKFYRDHRNRAQVGGTGLGLYLSKAIITAHGGNFWVRSQGEEQGSTFGFTILPYDKLPETLKASGEQGVTRSAHGWIKNHSLYRR